LACCSSVGPACCCCAGAPPFLCPAACLPCVSGLPCRFSFWCFFLGYLWVIPLFASCFFRRFVVSLCLFVGGGGWSGRVGPPPVGLLFSFFGSGARSGPLVPVGGPPGGCRAGGLGPVLWAVAAAAGGAFPPCRACGVGVAVAVLVGWGCGARFGSPGSAPSWPSGFFSARGCAVGRRVGSLPVGGVCPAGSSPLSLLPGPVAGWGLWGVRCGCFRFWPFSCLRLPRFFRCGSPRGWARFPWRCLLLRVGRWGWPFRSRRLPAPAVPVAGAGPGRRLCPWRALRGAFLLGGAPRCLFFCASPLGLGARWGWPGCLVLGVGLPWCWLARSPWAAPRSLGAGLARPCGGCCCGWSRSGLRPLRFPFCFPRWPAGLPGGWAVRRGGWPGGWVCVSRLRFGLRLFLLGPRRPLRCALVCALRLRVARALARWAVGGPRSCFFAWSLRCRCGGAGGRPGAGRGAARGCALFSLRSPARVPGLRWVVPGGGPWLARWCLLLAFVRVGRSRPPVGVPPALACLSASGARSAGPAVWAFRAVLARCPGALLLLPSRVRPGAFPLRGGLGPGCCCVPCPFPLLLSPARLLLPRSLFAPRACPVSVSPRFPAVFFSCGSYLGEAPSPPCPYCGACYLCHGGK